MLKTFEQLFMFINVKTKQTNQKILPLINMSAFPSFDSISEKERNIVFDFVIEENEWDVNDEVIAVGNHGDVVFREVISPPKTTLLKNPKPPSNGQPQTTTTGGSR